MAEPDEINLKQLLKSSEHKNLRKSLVEAAARAVSQGKYSYRDAENHFGINKSTILRCVRKPGMQHYNSSDRRRKLNEKSEMELANYINKNIEAMTLQEIKKKALELRAKDNTNTVDTGQEQWRVKKLWVCNFLSRHHITLNLKPLLKHTKRLNNNITPNWLVVPAIAMNVADRKHVLSKESERKLVKLISENQNMTHHEIKSKALELRENTKDRWSMNNMNRWLHRFLARNSIINLSELNNSTATHCEMSGTDMSIKEELPFPDEDILIHAAHNQEISIDSNYENEDPDEDRSGSEENNDAKKEEQSDSTEDDSVDDNRDSKEVDKKFKCQFCPQAYETLHLVRLHLKISHADEDFVKNMFKVEEQYNQTWVKHLVKEKNPAETTDLNVIVCSGQDKKSFKCPLCPNTYATKASVIRHIERNHSTEGESSSDEETTVKSKKEKLIKCPFCPNVYSCNGNVQRHIQKNHSKTEDQKCDSNKATDNTIEEESEKVKEPEFKCPFCPQEYFTKRSVGRHVDTNHPKKAVGFHHRNLKKSKSRESNENHPKGPKGSTETVIREKENKEANPIRFSCSLCPNSYTRNGDLRRHEKDHHNLANKFVCTICNQRFDSENKLKLHQSAIHSKSNPFKCDQCDRAFKNQGGLLWHLKSHSGPHTPRTILLSCPVKACKFQTDRENNLKRHSIVHTNIRAFSCNVCHKKFKSKDHVSRHVEGVHSDVNMFSRVCRAFFVNRVKQMKSEREREILRESVSELRDEEDSNLSDAF